MVNVKNEAKKHKLKKWSPLTIDLSYINLDWVDVCLSVRLHQINGWSDRAQIVCRTIRKCDPGKDYDLTKFDYKNFENQQNIFYKIREIFCLFLFYNESRGNVHNWNNRWTRSTLKAWYKIKKRVSFSIFLLQVMQKSLFSEKVNIKIKILNSILVKPVPLCIWSVCHFISKGKEAGYLKLRLESL